MQKPTKEKIIAAYNDLVKERGGKLIGERIFARETGFSHHYWKGGFWRSWSAFQSEAGYIPNIQTSKIPDEILLYRYAELALERNALPSEADLMLKRKDDPSFPNKLAYRRWGTRDQLLEKVAEYCQGEEKFASVVRLLSEGFSNSLDQKIDSQRIKGFVYLLRSGKNYKIGRSNAVGRRLRELAIQLPKKPNMVHVITTVRQNGVVKS